MKGVSILFKNSTKNLKFRLDLQLFASKRVSHIGTEIQEKLQNQRLKNVVGELYRFGASVGDGSAMAAASLQVKTGQLTGGKDHIMKIEQRISNLKNIMKHEALNESDSKYAKTLLDKMEKSLKGEY